MQSVRGCIVRTPCRVTKCLLWYAIRDEIPVAENLFELSKSATSMKPVIELAELVKKKKRIQRRSAGNVQVKSFLTRNPVSGCRTKHPIKIMQRSLCSLSGSHRRQCANEVGKLDGLARRGEGSTKTTWKKFPRAPKTTVTNSFSPLPHRRIYSCRCFVPA